MRSPLKYVLAAGALALLGGLFGGLGAARPPSASAEEVRGELDVSVFYEALAPYGDWVHVAPYGWVWLPDDVDYDWRPYTVGRWVWIDDFGWTWASDEEWGWAVYHYGRWTWLDGYGWAWVPGTVWAPAWVVFRSGDGWVGWAPRPPEPAWRLDTGLDLATLDMDVGSWGWAFVPVRDFAEPQLRSRLVRNIQNARLLRMTRASTRYAVVDGRVVNRSVDLTEVEKARGVRITHHRLEEGTRDDRAVRTRVDGEAVRIYRPKVAPKAPEKAPAPRARTAADVSADAWLEKRRAALKAHLDAQAKAAEEDPDAAGTPPKTAPSAEEAQKRREAARQALEEERKRAEAQLEWQRRRRQRDDAKPDEKPPEKPAEKPKDAKPPETPPKKPPETPKDDKDKDKDKRGERRGMDGD